MFHTSFQSPFKSLNTESNDTRAFESFLQSAQLLSVYPTKLLCLYDAKIGYAAGSVSYPSFPSAPRLTVEVGKKRRFSRAVHPPIEVIDFSTHNPAGCVPEVS